MACRRDSPLYGDVSFYLIVKLGRGLDFGTQNKIFNFVKDVGYV